MRVLVTGGTGFLGRHLIDQLHERGDEVRVLARDRAATPSPAKWVGGDLVNQPAETLLRALDGCEGIYHLAGLVSRDESDGARMMQLHIEGTRRLMTAARAAGTRRLVLGSTSGTIAVSRSPEALDERAPYPTEMVSRWPYYLSKIYQEKLAFELAAPVELVVVNPSLLLGPGDARRSSTGDVLRFLRREIPIVPGGGISFVDARDAAAALVAMERGRPGERYLVGGPNWTCGEFFGRLERASKVRGPYIKLPAAITKRAAGLLGSDLRVSIEMGELFWWCDSDKARRELGFLPRDPGETLDATIRDLRSRMI